MILDSLANLDHYVALHPAFAAASEFLAALDPAPLTAGRLPIDGDRIYAMVVDTEGKGESDARLETHRDYLDIQYQVAGTDRIGWSPAAGLVGEGYSRERDIEFHPGQPATWVDVAPGHVAIFLPTDAHAPLGGTGHLLKVVVKIKTSWDIVGAPAKNRFLFRNDHFFGVKWHLSMPVWRLRFGSSAFSSLGIGYALCHGLIGT